MFSYYKASIGRFSENALSYGFISKTESHEVRINFDKLRIALRHPSLISINQDLEILKANELLNSIMKQLHTNYRIFVHAPFKLIKSIESSITALYKD